MAWRWVKKLVRTNKSQSRRIVRTRRLRVESLESRAMLAAGTITIGGTVAVANLVGSSGNVPVRGIHIHAWIGDNAAYNPNPANSAQGQNGTAPGGVFGDAYTNSLGAYTLNLTVPNGIAVGQTIHVVAIAQSNSSKSSQYQLIQSSYGSPDPTRVYFDQFADATVASLATSTTATCADDDTLTAPPADRSGGSHQPPSKAQQTALAFAAFSITETSYDFATSVLHAKLAKTIYIEMPLLHGYDISSAIGSSLIVLGNNFVDAPDVIGHEFGHLVAEAGGFLAPTASENHHSAESNQRTRPPTTPVKTAPNGSVTNSDLGIAWNEGFADWFAVAAKTAVSTAGLNVTTLDSDFQDPAYSNGAISYPANAKGGWGEDNEISVMRVLWAYSKSKGHTDAGLYIDLTVLDVYQNPPRSLTDFWNNQAFLRDLHFRALFCDHRSNESIICRG